MNSSNKVEQKKQSTRLTIYQSNLEKKTTLSMAPISSLISFINSQLKYFSHCNPRKIGPLVLWSEKQLRDNNFITIRNDLFDMFEEAFKFHKKDSCLLDFGDICYGPSLFYDKETDTTKIHVPFITKEVALSDEDLKNKKLFVDANIPEILEQLNRRLKFLYEHVKKNGMCEFDKEIEKFLKNHLARIDVMINECKYIFGVKDMLKRPHTMQKFEEKNHSKSISKPTNFPNLTSPQKSSEFSSAKDFSWKGKEKKIIDTSIKTTSDPEVVPDDKEKVIDISIKTTSDSEVVPNDKEKKEGSITKKKNKSKKTSNKETKNSNASPVIIDVSEKKSTTSNDADNSFYNPTYKNDFLVIPNYYDGTMKEISNDLMVIPMYYDGKIREILIEKSEYSRISHNKFN